MAEPLCMTWGDLTVCWCSYESTLVAVAVPDEEQLPKWAAKAGVSGAQHVADAAVRPALLT